MFITLYYYFILQVKEGKIRKPVINTGEKREPPNSNPLTDPT